MDSVSHDVAYDVTPRREGFRRFEVISGERRRRAWTADEKLAIIAESFSSTTSISDVARRHQLNRNQLFQWRGQFRRGELGEPAMMSFLPVRIAEPSHPAASAPTLGGRPDEPVVEVVIGAATVRIAPSVDDVTLRRVLAAVRDLR